MRGVLQFWLFMLETIIRSMFLGPVLVGPGLLLWWWTGSTWLILAWFVPALIGVVTFAVWER